MPKFWIFQSSEHGRFLNMRALQSVLNMPEYALTDISDYKYPRILNMAAEYVRIYNNRQGSEHVSNNKWVNEYKLTSTYWEIGVFRRIGVYLSRDRRIQAYRCILIEVYSESCQRSETERFEKIINPSRPVHFRKL